MAEDLVHRGTLTGVGDEDALDQRGGSGGEVVRDGVSSLHDRHDDTLQPVPSLGFERHDTTRKHDVQDHTARPDVRLEAVVALPEEDLRGGVVGSAALRLQTQRLRDLPVLVHVLEAREPEVGNLQRVVGSQQKVLRLQVSVHNALFVAVVDTVAELAEVRPGRGVVEPLVVLNEAEELSVGSQLDHKVETLRRLEHLVQPQHVVVVQRLHRRNLPLQQRPALPLREHLLRAHLHCNAFAALGVGPQVHLAEAAMPKHAAQHPVADLLHHQSSSPRSVARDAGEGREQRQRRRARSGTEVTEGRRRVLSFLNEVQIL
eukprot:Rhum_TRINITY_DN15428_c2_g1::Rhum_TRINITY_DN15428_c2_g1_i1::g.155731::m.155731